MTGNTVLLKNFFSTLKICQQGDLLAGGKVLNMA
jgi:hypothetical protein